jgi:DNA-binding CsgD family transcriptional regulator
MLDLNTATPFGERRVATVTPLRATPPARATSAAPLAHAVLDSLPQAMAVLDATGNLAYWNVAARTRLGAAGWRVVDQRLQAPAAMDRDTLARALPNVCLRGRRQLLPLSLDGRVAHAALTPIDVQGQWHALLLLDRETLCGGIELQLFASSNHLTPAESRVLERLADGQRPAQIAREHGVSVSTVLSQIASLRSKTNSPSVPSLLALLARLPALQARCFGSGPAPPA